MDGFLHSVLDLVSRPVDDDQIISCECEHMDTIVDHAEDLLKVADQKLHVFPFKEVKSCWFRLYTDASLAKAVKLILANILSADAAAAPTQDEEWIDQVVATLDKALIMAGGLGREAIIHEILQRLQDHLSGKDDGRGRERTRRKANHNEWTGFDSESRVLPVDVTSIPNIRFPVSSLSRPSLGTFQKHMANGEGPAILKDILQHWPAMELWKSLSYWHRHTFGGRRLVPVELGRSYVDDDWGQKLMSFEQFMQYHILLVHGSEHQKGYLAQHNLLKQIPSLHSAIAIPDYCYLDAPPPEPGTPVALSKAKTIQSRHPTLLPLGQGDPYGSKNNEFEDDHDVQTNFWFGPAWSITPLHHDPYHNILCQVVGNKYIRLYSPHESAKLYPRSSSEPAPHLQAANAAELASTIDMSNTSSVDIAAMELSPDEDWDAIYPGVNEIPYVECVLEAGQALYIPVGWWHYVRSCSVGISVSFWW